MWEGMVLNDRYLVHQLIGRGTQGECWLVSENDYFWLAKIYRLSHEGWERYQQVERESQILCQLEDPAIPKFRDMFMMAQERSLCLIREWISGQNLEQYIAGRRMAEAEVRQMAIQLLRVLHYIHGLSPAVIHRDIKPSNVILRPDFSIALIDFGSVRDAIYSDNSFSVMGTYGYTPPEQFFGHPTPASDLYALGATMIYLLSRRPPASLPLVRNRLQFEPYINVQQRFLRILQRLLSPEVEDRFQSAKELIQALERCEQTTEQIHYPHTEAIQHIENHTPSPRTSEHTETSSQDNKAANIPWQRNRDSQKRWLWESLDYENTAQKPKTTSPRFPDLIAVIRTLQQRYYIQYLDEFSDPLELVDAIDRHFGKEDETGREWLLKLLHPYDASDILFGFYDPVFILPNHHKALIERFSLLFTHHSDNSIGKYTLLYFLYKHGWPPKEQRHYCLNMSSEVLPTEKYSYIAFIKRFFERYRALPIGKQAQNFDELNEHWQQIALHYHLCVTIRPDHIALIVERGIREFERDLLSTYPEQWQTLWQTERRLYRQLNKMTRWRKRWYQVARAILEVSLFPINKYLAEIKLASKKSPQICQEIGDYIVAIHQLHNEIKQLCFRLREEYSWLLTSSQENEQQNNT